MPEIKQSKWKTVEYSKSQIIKAGKTIRNNNATAEELATATHIIDNWRAAHAYPLHVIYMHLRHLAERAENPSILVAERLKRLDSIIGKLKRFPRMSLYEMQDLGGCRFIVPTVDDVYKYSQIFKNSRMRHKFEKEYDYIGNPKGSGYRSLHLVYLFHSEKKDTYNKNMLIEIQFRTHLQHVWATAVETMGLFTNQALKSGQGEEYIKRFFVLVSSLFAMEEGCPIIPGTIDNEQELISEIEQIDNEYYLLRKLSAIQVALDYQDKHLDKVDKKGYYVLILNYDTCKLRIKYFSPSQFEDANVTYTKIEQSKNNSNIDAVLVRVASFSQLKAAYPNYFADIGEFIRHVQNFLK